MWPTKVSASFMIVRLFCFYLFCLFACFRLFVKIYAPVPRIVRRGIYKNKIVWLPDFRVSPRKKTKTKQNKTNTNWILYEFLPNPVNTRFSGSLLTVPYWSVWLCMSILETWQNIRWRCFKLCYGVVLQRYGYVVENV